MDDQRFDVWTRELGAPRDRSSRRAGLRLLAAGALIPVLQRLTDPVAEAKKTHKKKKCKSGKKPCGKYCISEALCCTSKDCGWCEYCSSADGKCKPKLKQLCFGDCEQSVCSTVTNDWECVGCSVGNTCCHGICQADTERCCATAGWKPCPGQGACCDDMGQCTKNGRSCCAEGLVACDDNCAIGSC